MSDEFIDLLMGGLPDWTWSVPKQDGRRKDFSIRIPADHAYQVGEHVPLTYDGSTYDTVIDSIVPDGDGFVKVHALLTSQP